MLEYLSNLLKQLGIPVSLQGYDRLRTAILWVYEDPKLIHKTTTQLYPALAKKYAVSDKGIERSIRLAIETAWDQGDALLINRLFEYTVNSQKGRPTNRQFIAVLADHLRLRFGINPID